MNTLGKPASKTTRASLAAHPRAGKLNVAAAHKKIAKRFPKVLADLAK